MSIVLTTLSSHVGTGAEDAMADLKKAATTCATGLTVFNGVDDTSKYSKIVPVAYNAGDEALAYTTKVVKQEASENADIHLVVVRKGSTIATFTTSLLGGKAKPSKAIVDAQLKKLG
ncbi:hypothetical protein ACH4E8_17135 [Streptomyces sp. NPDC017979]|uniref:hypothetical protein n=1 Tax=Streptomyces sp. NPDC017979 TaxID=3365024 RepID=UPI0037AD0F06